MTHVLYNLHIENDLFICAMDNYAERMTCAAEDRYDYLTDR